MRKIFSLMLLCVAVVFASCSKDDDTTTDPVAVAFSSLTANGSATETTTVLTLTFDQVIEGLTAEDVTLTAGETGAAAGVLTAKGSGVYELAVSGIIKAGEVTVAVAKRGYTITPASKVIAVSYVVPVSIETGKITINAGNIVVASIVVNNQSNLNIQKQGIVYGTNSNLDLTSSDVVIVDAILEQDGTAKVIMDKMAPGTVYYYRAFASINEDITYGKTEQFTAYSKAWSRITDYAVDFESENCIDDFTVVKLAGKGIPWYVIPMSVQGLPRYMIVSSAIDVPDLFEKKLSATGDADNILQYEANLTGKILPAIGFYALDIDGFKVGWDRNSTIDVLVSPNPITTSAEADAADKIGSVGFSAKEFQADVRFLLPIKYSNTKCYIALRNKATVTSSFGVFLGDFYLTSLKEPK